MLKRSYQGDLDLERSRLTLDGDDGKKTVSLFEIFQFWDNATESPWFEIECIYVIMNSFCRFFRYNFNWN